MTRVTRKTIFICVPNTYGLGYQIRDKFFEKDQPGLYPANIRPKRFISILNHLNWHVVKTGYFDIPPWPDIAMKKEDLLQKLGLGFILKKKKDASNSNNRLCITDFFSGKNPDMENQILKYGFLERAPFPIKQLWGHHRYFIFERGT